MTDTRYPSRMAAYEAGRAAGAQEERERLAAEAEQAKPENDGPSPITYADLKAGKYSAEDLIGRSAEVDAALAAEAR